MATNKPRITITLEDADYAILKRLSSLNGVPMSRTVKELVEAVAPVLSRVCDNLEKVRLVDENMKKRLVESSENALAELENLYSSAITNWDMFSSELDSMVQAAAATARSDAGARSRGDAAAGVPPSSNTGVRNLNSIGSGG